ncbi:hypothetical protein ANTRET_LOCUS3842 [Anthophora retusa]
MDQGKTIEIVQDELISSFECLLSSDSSLVKEGQITGSCIRARGGRSPALRKKYLCGANKNADVEGFIYDGFMPTLPRRASSKRSSRTLLDELRTVQSCRSSIASVTPAQTEENINKPQIIYAPSEYQSSSSSLNYPMSAQDTSYHNYHDSVPRDYAEASKKDRNREDSLNEEEITKKMRILDLVLSEDSSQKDLDTNGLEDKIINEESRRVVRQVRKQKPGFFWTLARITFETINDTRSAIKQISDIINNSIAPDSAIQSTMTNGALTSAGLNNSGRNVTSVNATETMTNASTTTTEAPYVLTRATLQRLIRRNVLGLVRLFNIEWKDALNQSDVTVKEFQKDLGNQIGIYLKDNPNAY